MEVDADDPLPEIENEDNDEEVGMINRPEQEQLETIEGSEDEAEGIKSTGRHDANFEIAGA